MSSHVKSPLSESGAWLLQCTFLILVWGLVPHLSFGFQQATRMDTTSFWLTITTAQLLGVTMFEHPGGQSSYSGESRVWLDVLYKQHKRKQLAKINLRLTHFCGIYSIMGWCATRPKTACLRSMTRAPSEARCFFIVLELGFRRKQLFEAKKMGLLAQTENHKRFACLPFWATPFQRSHRSLFCCSNPAKLKRAITCPACETPLQRQWYRSFLAPCSHVAGC